MVNIREAEENDIRAIGHIYTRAFGHTEEVISYFSGFGEYVRFCMKQHYAFVVEKKSEICGVILGYEKPDMINGKSVYIELLAVLPEYQGKGFGKALIEKIENAAVYNGIKEVSLRTGCYMDAFHIYYHLGFRDTRDDQRYMVKHFKKC